MQLKDNEEIVNYISICVGLILIHTLICLYWQKNMALG